MHFNWKSSVLPGDGVDLKVYKNIGVINNKTITFLFVARLIWEKGLKELVEAFKIVNKIYPNTKLVIAGGYYLDNPSAVEHNYIDNLVKSGLISYLGHIDNIVEVIAKCDCLVLPSYYREGLPRVLLEASSMGKPIIITKNVGCKDAVEDGITGYLVEPKSYKDLADSMIKYVLLSFTEKRIMGQNGRRKMEMEFSQDIVIKKYLEVL